MVRVHAPGAGYARVEARGSRRESTQKLPRAREAVVDGDVDRAIERASATHFVYNCTTECPQAHPSTPCNDEIFEGDDDVRLLGRIAPLLQYGLPPETATPGEPWRTRSREGGSRSISHPSPICIYCISVEKPWTGGQKLRNFSSSAHTETQHRGPGESKADRHKSSTLSQ